MNPTEALDYMQARTPKIVEHDTDYREAAGVARAAIARLAAYDDIVGAIMADPVVAQAIADRKLCEFQNEPGCGCRWCRDKSPGKI